MNMYTYRTGLIYLMEKTRLVRLMLNYIWLGMIVLGVIWAVVTGRLNDVTQAVTSSAEEGVQLSITLMGILCLWSGLMRVAEKSGLIRMITRFAKGFFSELFPDIPEKHSAMGAMVLSFTANFLGLGNAATPLGIKAMEELQTLNSRKDTATDAMVLFMVINASCLQLIPTNVVALRAAAGSADAAAILPHVWISSSVSTIAAIVFYYIFSIPERRRIIK